jgi:hypothetical protein
MGVSKTLGVYSNLYGSISHRMMVLGATDRLSCIVSLSKFYSSGDPLSLGDSPSAVFTAVLEKSHVRQGANRRCLQSNKVLVQPSK